MRQFKWVSAVELNRWADTVQARLLLPRLIRLLINATVEKSEIEHLNFPSEEETHRPGYDGETKIKRGNAKVPDGITYWEMGTNSQVKKKLDEDYAKRLDSRGGGDFQSASYIAITPRDYQEKKAWCEEKQRLGNWHEVRLYDSDDLEQWLEMAPAVGNWLSSACIQR